MVEVVALEEELQVAATEKVFQVIQAAKAVTLDHNLIQDLEAEVAEPQLFSSTA